MYARMFSAHTQKAHHRAALQRITALHYGASPRCITAHHRAALQRITAHHRASRRIIYNSCMQVLCRLSPYLMHFMNIMRNKTRITRANDAYKPNVLKVVKCLTTIWCYGVTFNHVAQNRINAISEYNVCMVRFKKWLNV